jgi:hypothetical protein
MDQMGSSAQGDEKEDASIIDTGYGGIYRFSGCLVYRD